MRFPAGRFGPQARQETSRCAWRKYGPARNRLVIFARGMLLAVGFGAAAFGSHFRVYSIATIAVVLVSGLLTSLDAPGLAANCPTPLIGAWERISIAAFLLLVVVIAVAFCRCESTPVCLRRTHARGGIAAFFRGLSSRSSPTNASSQASRAT